MAELVVNLDFESRATVDLKKSGVYPYAEHADTALWCAGFAINGNADDVRMWTPDDDYGHNDDLRHAISEGASIRAWNAAFERVMWQWHMVKRFGFAPLPIERFYCTAGDAAACSLPRALDNAGRVLRTLTQKDGDGKKLMLKMAKPRNAAAMKKDPALRPEWWDDAGMRRALEGYCAQDVRAEIAVAERIRQITPAERRIYVLDQRINDRGVKLDTSLASALSDLADEATNRANESVREVSSGAVAGVTKLRDMLAFVTSLGVETAKLDKQAVTAILDRIDTPEAVRQILELRREAAKTSVRKVKAMFACASRGDSRMRGAMLYHGAGTGRFAHKLYQPGNLPSRTKLVGYKPERWIERVVARDYDTLDLMYPVLEALAMLLRSCLTAAEGKRFIGADFNAIEARVLAWLAGETWILDAFRNGTDLYRLMAADIYGLMLDQVGKPSPERDMGKRAILGCGFQMGYLKFIATCLREAGIVLDEAFGKRVVSTYREKNEAIVAFWYELERAAVEAVRYPGRTVFAAGGKLKFIKRGEFLNIILPNRTRALAYYRPTIRDKLTPWGAMKPCVSFWGENSKRQWVSIDLYGGLLAENVTQATARDFMCDAMLRLEAAGYPILLTVHDEILAEVDEDFGSVAEFEKIMCDLPAGYWGEGCPITAEGWTGPRFRK